MNPPPPAAPPTAEETAVFIELLYKKYQPVMHWATKLQTAAVTVSCSASLVVVLLLIIAMMSLVGASKMQGGIIITLAITGIIMGIFVGTFAALLNASARHHRANVTGHITNCPHLSLRQATELLQRLSQPHPVELTNSPPKPEKSVFIDA